MSKNAFDVVTIGGGLMGCSTAYHLLKTDPTLKVAIIEMDPNYEKASTSLSDGNIRVQFNIKENVQMSLYGLEVLENFSEEMSLNNEMVDIAFHQQGNLFLQNMESQQEAIEGLSLQQSLGGKVEWLSPAQIKQCYPLCDPKDIVGATFGYQDGSMDPWAVLIAYKNKAIELGSDYVHSQVIEVIKSNNQVKGVKLITGEEIHAPIVLNSAGAWGAIIAKSAGIDLPMEPIKRHVFVIETNSYHEGKLPAIFFPSGLYIIHESQGKFMIGKSFANDPIGFDFKFNKNIFTDRIWPELVEYIPSFDRLKVVGGWAGLYAVNTMDGNAILGEWPDLKGLYLSNGFSGHGFQQCHAVGRYITELILNSPISLDLSLFSPRRIIENDPVFESKRKLI